MAQYCKMELKRSNHSKPKEKCNSQESIILIQFNNTIHTEFRVTLHHCSHMPSTIFCKKCLPSYVWIPHILMNTRSMLKIQSSDFLMMLWFKSLTNGHTSMFKQWKENMKQHLPLAQYSSSTNVISILYSLLTIITMVSKTEKCLQHISTSLKWNRLGRTTKQKVSFSLFENVA